MATLFELLDEDVEVVVGVGVAVVVDAVFVEDDVGGRVAVNSAGIE